MNNSLVIINGVTGAIGSACLAYFARLPHVQVIGLSRQALPVETFCREGKLPSCTFICNMGDTCEAADCRALVNKLDLSLYQDVRYIHAVGVYPFELSDLGEIQVAHDEDGDGIDDRVLQLSYQAFFAMTEALESTGLPLKTVLFAGLADRHRPLVHRSWWTVMERVRERLVQKAEGRQGNMYGILAISSVLCPNELLTRPFVFRDTNASPTSWLTPGEVAEGVAKLFECERGLAEQNLFHPSSYYEEGYFSDEKFTPRKRAELGI